VMVLEAPDCQRKTAPTNLTQREPTRCRSRQRQFRTVSSWPAPPTPLRLGSTACATAWDGDDVGGATKLEGGGTIRLSAQSSSASRWPIRKPQPIWRRHCVGCLKPTSDSQRNCFVQRYSSLGCGGPITAVTQGAHSTHRRARDDETFTVTPPCNSPYSPSPVIQSFLPPVPLPAHGAHASRGAVRGVGG